MKSVRPVVVMGLAAVALPCLFAGGWTVQERARDPLTALRRGDLAVRVVRDSSYQGSTGAGEARLFRDLTVETGTAGTIRVTTSRPAEAGTVPLPLVFILAGLRTGKDALAVVQVHGPNLLVGYEYPYSQETWYERAKIGQIPVIRKAVLDVPAQVALMARHLAADPSVDGERTALLGYSFGAMFVPAVQRLAVEGAAPFQALVLAYGGADLGLLLDSNIKLKSRPLRRGLAWLGATALHPMEPAHHLPHLSGTFLVIRGELDEKIPPASSARLADLTPDPKTVVSLAEGHMGPGNPELTARIVRISQDWLIGEGFIEAPTTSW